MTRFAVGLRRTPSARPAPHPNPLPAANPQPPAGRGDLRVAPLTRSAQLTQTESPLPAGGVGVGGGERVRVRGGSRPKPLARKPSPPKPPCQAGLAPGLTAVVYFSFIDGSPKRIQERRTSGSVVAALARRAESPRVWPANICRNISLAMSSCG